MFVKMCIASLRDRLLNELQMLDSIPSPAIKQLCAELEEAQVHREAHDSSFQSYAQESRQITTWLYHVLS